MSKDESWNGMFWRFFAASDTEVDVAIFRDTDSRLHVRDKAAVEQWINSDKQVHIIRDGCQHGWTICGGLWGTKKNAIPDLRQRIENDETIKNPIFNKHGVDQIFLQEVIYPHIRDISLIHDEWFPNGFAGEEKHSMPIPRLRGEGWCEQEFPEWHSGTESDIEVYPHWHLPGRPGHCPYKCPACGEYHDNDYLGKVAKLSKEEKEKYSHLMEVSV